MTDNTTTSKSPLERLRAALSKKEHRPSIIPREGTEHIEHDVFKAEVKHAQIISDYGIKGNEKKAGEVVPVGVSNFDKSAFSKEPVTLLKPCFTM